jgi:magnesium transporter
MGEAAPRLAGEGPRVKTVACLGGISLERDVPSEDIREYIREARNLVWVDVQDPGPAELSMLLEEFGFHPLALEDVASGQQRPKVDEYKGYMFVVTYGVAAGADVRDLQTFEVDMFIGRNYLVTVHRGRIPALEDAFGRWTRGGAMLGEGVGFLVYTVMDAIIDAYFPIIDAIEDELDETELEMFTRSRQVGIGNLLKLKRTLFTLRRALSPLRETFGVFLRLDQPIFSPNTRIYFHDVYDHILRILDVVDIERDMVTGVLDGYMSVMSNRLNETMKTLTIVSVSMGIASCVFGLWGMNVADVPGFFTSLVFWAILAGTFALVVLALVFIRRQGWL